MDNISFLTKVSAATGIDIETSQKLVCGLSAAIGDKISQGDKVVIPGLGEFSSVIMPQYIQEDILTGRNMCMPESQQVVFTPSAILKKRL